MVAIPPQKGNKAKMCTIAYDGFVTPDGSQPINIVVIKNQSFVGDATFQGNQ